jgi:uncharacterized protein (DUF302 family)
MRIRSYLVWAAVAVIGGGAVPPWASASGSFEAPAPTVSIDPDTLGPRGGDGTQADWQRLPGRRRGAAAEDGAPASFADCAPVLPAIDTFLARQPGNVLVQPSHHRFLSTVQRLKAAIRDRGFVLAGSFDAQASLAQEGVVIGGSHALDVYRPDYTERLVATNPEAGSEVPVRIYVFEDSAGTVWVRYHSLQHLLNRYADPRLLALGQEVDAQVAVAITTAVE